MIIPEHPPRYHAYLLRCWEERGYDALRPPIWRFSLEVPHTGERHGFADLAQLVVFLQGFAEGGQDGGAGLPDDIASGGSELRDAF